MQAIRTVLSATVSVHNTNCGNVSSHGKVVWFLVWKAPLCSLKPFGDCIIVWTQASTRQWARHCPLKSTTEDGAHKRNMAASKLQRRCSCRRLGSPNVSATVLHPP